MPVEPDMGDLLKQLRTDNAALKRRAMATAGSSKLQATVDELAITVADLSTAQGTLATQQTTLATQQADLTTAQAELTATQADLAATQASLTQFSHVSANGSAFIIPTSGTVTAVTKSFLVPAGVAQAIVTVAVTVTARNGGAINGMGVRAKINASMSDVTLSQMAVNAYLTGVSVHMLTVDVSAMTTITVEGLAYATNAALSDTAYNNANLRATAIFIH